MLIDSTHPLIQSLTNEWEGARSGPDDGRLRLSEEFQDRLADLILGLLSPFAGELILLYHEFLTRVPSGAHSFAHGSEMVSETVYWPRAARLSAPVAMTKERSSGSEWGNEEHRIRIAPSTSFLLSTEWQWSLYPYYPTTAHRPSFGFNEPRKSFGWTRKSQEAVQSLPKSDPLDISCLGEHLFRVRQGKYDWATKICLVLGAPAVKGWFEERGSSSAYETLSAQPALS